jgi:hypothetical protein
MSDRVLRLYAASTLAAVLILGFTPAFAQSGDPKAADKPKAETPASAAAKDGTSAKKTEESSEAAKAASASPNPECKWLGTRVANLMWRQDLETAFRHLDLYDRFGCPGGHVQATFRCVVRNETNIDSKVPDSLNKMVNACWLNPAAQPAPPAAAQNPSAPTGTSAQ